MLLQNKIKQASKLCGGAGEVTGGSFAAAEVHDKVREDMASADLANLLFVSNKTCERFCEVNHFQGELYCELEPESDIKTELAQRDAIIAGMGFELSPEYIRETYGVEVSPRAAAAQMAFSQQNPVQIPAPSENPLFSQISQPQPNAAKPPRDAIDEALECAEFAQIAEQIEADYNEQIEKILNEASSYEEAFAAVANAQLKSERLDAAMAAALSAASEQGAASAERD